MPISLQANETHAHTEISMPRFLRGIFLRGTDVERSEVNVYEAISSFYFYVSSFCNSIQRRLRRSVQGSVPHSAIASQPALSLSKGSVILFRKVKRKK